jgi:hypothetical protein
MRFFVISAVLALTFLLLPAVAQQSVYVGGEFGKAWLKSSGNTASDLWTWGSPPKYYYDYYPYYYTGYGGYGYYGEWLPYIAFYPQDFYSPNFVYYPWDERRFSSINISRPPVY